MLGGIRVGMAAGRVASRRSFGPISALRNTSSRAFENKNAQRMRSMRVQNVFGARLFSTDEKKNSEENAKETSEKEETVEQVVGEEQAQEPAEADELAKALKRIEELEAEIKTQKQDTLRAYAEAENVRERSRRDVESARTYANQKFAKSLLDVADNLSRAIEAVADEQRDHPLYEGVMMTEGELLKVFGSHGITQFGEVGEAFDPNMHEALFTLPSEELEKNAVGQVIKKGYKLKDRVIRPAQVGTVA
mmetsp:Transcript_10930/g.17907  ORF Transcript_10930/g.17907 Transcript_10930/m.17907 type:complete len:249 (+) Transcript_10930:24-770(+)